MWSYVGSMPTRVCWARGALSNMSPRTDCGIKVPITGSVHAVRATYSCDNCGLLNVALAQVDMQYNRGGESAEYLLATVPADGITWLPLAGQQKHFPDVPSPIANAAAEVHRCVSIGATRAAVGLARAVVEATAKDKGVTSGGLLAKIDGLH